MRLFSHDKQNFDHIPKTRNSVQEINLPTEIFEKQSPLRSRQRFDHIPTQRNSVHEINLVSEIVEKQDPLRSQQTFNHILLKKRNSIPQHKIKIAKKTKKEDPLKSKETFDHIPNQRNKLNLKNTQKNYDHIKLSNVLHQSK